LKNTKHNIDNLLSNKPELGMIVRALTGNFPTNNAASANPDDSTSCISKREIYSTLKYDKLNQQEFVRLIKHHRLDSIFYKLVLEQKIELSIELKGKLEQINTLNKIRMMKLTAELIRIHKLFTENNIDYVSLKGPALSQQVFGDYTIRNSRDLDLLVREDDLEIVTKLLEKKKLYIIN